MFRFDKKGYFDIEKIYMHVAYILFVNKCDLAFYLKCY